MAANMYRVGDYVYFETSSTAPYQIRRIEELCKTSSGNVEAKVMCFYRRRDISSSLIHLADKHQNSLEEDYEDSVKLVKEELSEKQQHQMRHRELFLSRQVETLPATHIRGKCTVTLLNETESLFSYLNREDAFFYSLVYDPQQKTLLADKGEIRVGTRYQAEPMPTLIEGEIDGRTLADLEELVWDPCRLLDDKLVDSFLIITRSVGAFARALDCTSTVRQPSLHISAAAASRDITKFHAMDVLHKQGYNLSKAISSLVPSTGPVLCRDQIEEWSASEANLFEEALDKYGKDFADIRQDYLPWKTMKSIVEFYYMWKTTDRYVQQKRIKAAEAESKLKQVYIPNYNKPNPAQIVEKLNGADNSYNHICEGCYTNSSSQWFSWGPTQMQCRLCAACWNYWKKFGGLKMPTRLDGGGVSDRSNPTSSHNAHKCSVNGCGKEFRVRSQLARHLATGHGLVAAPGSPSPVMKTRAAFCLVTTQLTRISRRICRKLLNLKRAARQPFIPINIALIKQECQQLLPESVKDSYIAKVKRRVPMDDVSARLGVDVATDRPVLLQQTTLKTHPSRCAFPCQPALSAAAASPSTLPNHVPDQCKTSVAKKRGHEHMNGTEGAPANKYSAVGVIQQPSLMKQSSDLIKSHGCSINRVNGRSGKDKPVVRSRKHIVNWVETPDDVYFAASHITRKLRKQMACMHLKRAARQPWNKQIASSSSSSFPVKTIQSGLTVSKQSESVVILD